MPKVGEEEADLLWNGDWLLVRAMRVRIGMPAKEWFESLDARGTGRALAAFATVETSLRCNRPAGDRIGKVDASNCGLWELRVTAKGAKPPHLRAFYLRRAQTIWLATGFTKQKNKLTAQEVRAGDAVTAEWLDNWGKVV